MTEGTQLHFYREEALGSQVTEPGCSDQVCDGKSLGLLCSSLFSRGCSLEPSAAEQEGGPPLWCQPKCLLGLPPGIGDAEWGQGSSLGNMGSIRHEGLSSGEKATQGAPCTLIRKGSSGKACLSHRDAD